MLTNDARSVMAAEYPMKFCVGSPPESFKFLSKYGLNLSPSKRVESDKYIVMINGFIKIKMIL